MLQRSPYVTANRPWLELYNTRIPRPRPKRKSLDTPVRECSEDNKIETHAIEDPIKLSPIQRLLDDNMLATVMQFLPTYSVAQAACVCSAWRRAAEVMLRG